MKKFTAKIVDRKLIAEMTYEVVFELEADDFSFMAGQYVEVIIPELLFDDGTGNARDFAIVPVPGFKKRISIVFLASESGFKRSLINFPIGQIVKIRGPLGYFVLPENSEREIVF
ncbi:hypothetical protein KC865_05045, partial [Candidatus Kaiserbacteria bacterium]|nr:hypothetical protein [Candidatus Kaiserbacteria bacterium]